jgi:hypothetical protein
MIVRRNVVRSRSPSRLPRLFVFGVWSVTIVGFLLLWFAIPLFSLECESPCVDGPAEAAPGVLGLGIVVLVLAKLAWIVRARLRQKNGPPSDMGALRPVFVWALALIALPMLLLFGVGFVTDIEGPWRIATAPAYVVGAYVAPAIFVRRAVRQGVSGAKAVAAALGIGSLVLLLDLVVYTGAGDGALGSLLMTAVAGGALVWGSQVAPSSPSNPTASRHPVTITFGDCAR